MSETDKSSGAAAAGAQIDAFFAEYAKGVSTGFERLLEFRRQALDAAVQQNREWVSAWQKGTELVVEGYRQSAQSQKDLFEVGYDAAKQQLAATSSAAAETFKRGVETIVEAQRTVLGARDTG